MAAIVAQRSVPGEDIDTLIQIVNQLAVALNALTAKMDADGTLTATDWASTVGTMDTVSTIGKIR